MEEQQADPARIKALEEGKECGSASQCLSSQSVASSPDAIRARLEKITPGPWEVAPCSDADERRDIVRNYSEEDTPDGRIKRAHWIAELDASLDFDMSDDERDEAMSELSANADFIAHAPDDIRALVAEYDALRLALLESERQLREMALALNTERASLAAADASAAQLQQALDEKDAALARLTRAHLTADSNARRLQRELMALRAKGHE